MSKGHPYVREAAKRGYTVNQDGLVVSPKGRAWLCAASKSRSRAGRGSYRYFSLRVEGVSSSVLVHQLVAYLKYGKEAQDEGVQVRHRNGDPLDNRPDNILIGTRSDNQMDIPETVRARRGSFSRKLTRVQEIALRKDRGNGATYKVLMVKYGLAKSTVAYIVKKRTPSEGKVDG